MTITNASITLSSSADPLFAAYDPYSNTFHGASVGIASATRMWSIHRVTSAWDESTVTWNTAPTFTATNAVTGNSSPATNTDDMTFDVTALVQDMVDSGNHYGFYLKHDGTTAYSSYSFGSKDNKNTCSVAPTLSINPGLF